MEIWKNIEQYEDDYQVSNLGNVKSLKFKKEKILKTHQTKRGYLDVQLSKDGKVTHHSIHRLVGQAFIPNPYNLPEVNHIDGNKLNNNVENLEWVSQSENNLHAYKTKLRYVTKKQREASIKNIKIAHKKRQKEVKNDKSTNNVCRNNSKDY